MRARTVTLAISALIFGLRLASAHPPENKGIELYIGYSAGGGYDVYARALARHMERHLPGSLTVVPVNMPGAGSLVLANWLFNVAPKDGSVFGEIGRGIAFDPLLGSTKAHFNAT
jgi:tripartite-type tricarboxylate transporter receptor subunit TctC